jgi:uncharacterized LabA/DUF88 family protein
MEERNKLAVLIDPDNISPGFYEALIREVANYGAASVKRAYGDWSTAQLSSWKAMLHEYAVSPMQLFSCTTGKNSPDSSMVIDAMDLLHTEKFDGFRLVTSDSDFTKLATRIRESALVVYGFGEKKTPGSLQVACDKFVFLEALTVPSNESGGGKPAAKERKSKKPLNQDAKLIRLLRGAVEATSDDAGWANISAAGAHIANQSSFDSRNYGCRKLSTLIETAELFEIEQRNPRGNNIFDLYLRDKRFAE